MLPHGIIRAVIFGRHQAQERVVLLAANIAVADCRGIKINTNTPRHSPVRLEFINLIIGYHLVEKEEISILVKNFIITAS